MTSEVEKTVLDELQLSDRHEICLEDDEEAPADSEALDPQAAVALKPTFSFQGKITGSPSTDSLPRVSTVEYICSQSSGINEEDKRSGSGDSGTDVRGSFELHPGIALPSDADAEDVDMDGLEHTGEDAEKSALVSSVTYSAKQDYGELARAAREAAIKTRQSRNIGQESASIASSNLSSSSSSFCTVVAPSSPLSPRKFGAEFSDSTSTSNNVNDAVAAVKSSSKQVDGDIVNIGEHPGMSIGDMWEQLCILQQRLSIVENLQREEATIKQEAKKGDEIVGQDNNRLPRDNLTVITNLEEIRYPSFPLVDEKAAFAALDRAFPTLDNKSEISQRQQTTGHSASTFGRREISPSRLSATPSPSFGNGQLLEKPIAHVEKMRDPHVTRRRHSMAADGRLPTAGGFTDFYTNSR